MPMHRILILLLIIIITWYFDNTHINILEDKIHQCAQKACGGLPFTVLVRFTLKSFSCEHRFAKKSFYFMVLIAYCS